MLHNIYFTGFLKLLFKFKFYIVLQLVTVYLS